MMGKWINGRNGRRYPKAAFRESAKKYEGAAVQLDHPRGLILGAVTFRTGLPLEPVAEDHDGTIKPLDQRKGTGG